MDSGADLLIRGFPFAVGAVLRIGPVVEAAVGQRSAEALVEEQQQERNLHAFVGETVGIAAAVAFEEAVAFEFAQVSSTRR